ncbi:iron ABC transporter permease [Fictibacillus sp. Mic-4]|uniref:FecCD family ABC transporter permease n=1 Tax=Fictibacillus sp. Mic-4 TaxID=3132826 RepID=UPI003CE8AA70
MNGIIHSTRLKIIALFVGMLLLCLLMALSVVSGYTDTSWETAISAYTHFDGSNAQIIVKTSRVPRAIIGAVIGVSLAISGVILQAITRNPIASPEFFGINAGAGFFIVAAVTFLGISSLQQFMWIGFLGAGIAGISVYALGSAGREGLTPIRLTLAGAVMAALFASLTQGMLVSNEKGLEEVLFWLAGSVEGRKLELLAPVLPYLVCSWIGALFLARQLNTFSLGEDVAKGLGQRTGAFKLLATLLVILLCGGSVAVAGPIAFIGVVVPHFARFLVGSHHGWVISYSGVIGGILLVAADIAARFIIMPDEVPVGVMTAIIGTPFFIYIARKGKFK